MEKLMQIERDWSQSELVRGDGILERIIADDHLATEPNGKRVTKKELIAENAGPIEMVSNRVQEDDVTIRCYGEGAQRQRGLDAGGRQIGVLQVDQCPGEEKQPVAGCLFA